MVGVCHQLPLKRNDSLITKAALVLDRWQSICSTEIGFKTNGCLTLLTTLSWDCQRLRVHRLHPRKLGQAGTLRRWHISTASVSAGFQVLHETCKHKAWYAGYPGVAAANKQQTMKSCFQNWDSWLWLSVAWWLKAQALDSNRPPAICPLVTERPWSLFPPYRKCGWGCGGSPFSRVKREEREIGKGRARWYLFL